MEQTDSETWVVCNCCGHIIRNNAEENVSFGQVPYPDDQGFGTCKECYGDKQSGDFKTRLGWAGRIFYDSRIELLKTQLNPPNLAKFEAMSYERQVVLIGRLIEKGAMI